MTKLFYYLKRLFAYLFYIIFRPIWWLELLIPKSKSIWIFGAWYGKKYSDNPKWLFEYINSNEGKKITLKNGKKIIPVWITKNKDVYKKLKSLNYKVHMSYTFAGIWTELRASYSFLGSGNIDINPWFSNRIKQIWLWHGMPLKKIGYADQISVKNNTKLHRKIAQILNPYTMPKYYSTLTSADFFTTFLEQAFDIEREKVWNTGLPRNDSFFNNTWAEKKEVIIENLRVKYNGCKILFFLPTFRLAAIEAQESIDSSDSRHAYNAFDTKYGFNGQEFETFLEKNNIVFLYKPHFVDTGAKIDVKGDRFVYLDDSMFSDLYTLLNSVDGVITDYSSVYFDFIASGKPLFLLPFDYEYYVTHSRAHFFDMKKEMGAPICTNWQQFYKAANLVKEDGTKRQWLAPSKDEIKKFSEYCDGSSCRKVVEKVIEDAGK